VKTQSAMTMSGFVKTGDICHFTQDAKLVLEGRISDAIVRSGEVVLTSGLEAMICRCPGVRNAVVDPIPDEEFYQTICACVEPEPHAGLTARYVQEFCENYPQSSKSIKRLPDKYILFDAFQPSIVPQSKIKRLFIRKRAQRQCTH
jgi:non-ribosomal peptide synthetase component E (peptide arylation enzyme)